MKEFEVGDEVGSLTKGHGVIVGIYSEYEYPVIVDFCFSSKANAQVGYTSEGKLFVSDLNQEIYPLEDFKKRFDLPLYATWPDLEEGARVWAKIELYRIWHPFHFSHFFGGDMYVFDSGRTSHTETIKIKVARYSLTKPE